jgi:hypothetical protein
MKLSDLANLIQYDKFLFHKNIRYYKGTTDVNDAMEKTLVTDQQHFWYLNNGITILCRKLTKTALNGSSNTWGTFECEDVSVVNGAQTVGVIWNVYRKNTAAFAGSDATVHVRLISLEHCPSDFDLTLTTATNTQNRIEFRDFAALDQTQQRIAREMHLDNRHYAFKSGDSHPSGMEGCDLEDATVALACASHDINLAILAKREIGAFWRNLKAPPYTTLFNEDLTATELWRAVQVYRTVGEELQRASSENQQIAIHGNRFILFHVFEDAGVRRFKNPTVDEGEVVARARACVPLVLTKVADAVRRKYDGAYLQPLFKNSERCRTLLDELPHNPDPPNDDLFDWATNKSG